MSDYEYDFYAWTQAQATALRAGGALDIEHLAEEIEDLGKRDRRAVESYLEVILIHLLKWTYQPTHRSKSWERSLVYARHRLQKLLRESPSLQNQLPDLLHEAYSDAFSLAVFETGLPFERFPERCPWTVDQIVSPGYRPGLDEA